jgi:PKD repeat protein
MPEPEEVRGTPDGQQHPAAHRAAPPPKSEGSSATKIPEAVKGTTEKAGAGKPDTVPSLKENWLRARDAAVENTVSSDRGRAELSPEVAAQNAPITVTQPSPTGTAAPVVAGHGVQGVSGIVPAGVHRKELGDNRVAVTSLPSPTDDQCRTVIFDASKSHDPDDDQLKYEWDFGDQSPKARDARIRHTFPQAGEYTVTLTVTDNSGGTCSTNVSQRQVTINSAPVAVGIFPKQVRPGESGLFDARHSYDTPGDRLSYSWDFGDGTTGSDPVAAHRFEKPGHYNVVLTVKDSSGTPCDTNVVTSDVDVGEEPVRPALAITPPETLVPERPEPAPIIPVPEEGETEMKGLMSQVREHQGEEEKPVAVAPLKPSLPILQVADTPEPERAPPPPSPKFIPDTHRYVLAWAGGYLVDCPTVNCNSETDTSQWQRMEQRLGHLIEAVAADRVLLQNLQKTSTSQKKFLVKYDQELKTLHEQLAEFQEKSNGEVRTGFARMIQELNQLEEKFDKRHQQVYAMAAQNATDMRQIGDEFLRHKALYESQRNYSPVSTSPKEPRRLPVSPDEEN